MMVPTKAVEYAATALREKILAYVARATGEKIAHCHIEDDRVVYGRHKMALVELYARGAADGVEFAVFRKAYGAPRTVAFMAYGVRLAVHCVTGEIVILYSAEAVDAGVVMNPHQLRGQVVGGVVMGIGHALQEKMVYDDAGAVINPTLRNYRIPAMADAPPTDVFFADTYDAIGPLGSKSIAENTNTPVPPAIANALRDATGIRFTSLPLTEDRIFARLAQRTPEAEPVVS
jgi:CO/xanthine dehydrogenase Mo-binding subunit